MTDGRADDAGHTFRLIYRSHDLIAAETRKAELGELFSAARSNNKARHITGALLVHEDWFVQTLEGAEDAVRALFEHIARDPRHDAVELLEAQTAGQRVFGHWSMARVAADPSRADTTLIAHQDGISPAASRSHTADQDALLATMRDAARAARQAAT